MVYNVSDGRVYKSFVPLVYIASSYIDIIKEERRIHKSTTKRPSSYGDGVCVLTYYGIPSGFKCMPFYLFKSGSFFTSILFVLNRNVANTILGLVPKALVEK